jgi:hypothetical protein
VTAAAHGPTRAEAQVAEALLAECVDRRSYQWGHKRPEHGGEVAGQAEDGELDHEAEQVEAGRDLEDPDRDVLAEAKLERGGGWGPGREHEHDQEGQPQHRQGHPRTVVGAPKTMSETPLPTYNPRWR